MSNNAWRVTLGICLIVSILGCGRAGEQENVVPVRRGAIDATVDALGRVVLVRQLDLSAAVAGTIRAVRVAEGEQALARNSRL